MKFRYSPVALAVFAALGSAGADAGCRATGPASGPVARARDHHGLQHPPHRPGNGRAGRDHHARADRAYRLADGGRSAPQAVPSTPAALQRKLPTALRPARTAISLRGLGQKATLVLLNGRRVAGYGFAQNIQDTFVDLNAIPTSAIERIEILKDGASAIYGSDAIAGVVNVILRRDYQGIEAAAQRRLLRRQERLPRQPRRRLRRPRHAEVQRLWRARLLQARRPAMADTEFGETRDYRERRRRPQLPDR